MESLHTVTCNNVTLCIRDVKFMLHRGPHTAHFDLKVGGLVKLHFMPVCRNLTKHLILEIS